MPDYLEFGPDKEVRNGKKYLGRFGRKATTVTLLHQTVNAYKNDMGISTDFDPVDIFNPTIGSTLGDNVVDPELSAETVQSFSRITGNRAVL